MKTPEQYLQEQVILPDERSVKQGFTPEERQFLSKYMGLGDGDVGGGRVKAVTVSPKDIVSMPGLGNGAAQAAVRPAPAVAAPAPARPAAAPPANPAGPGAPVGTAKSVGPAKAPEEDADAEWDVEAKLKQESLLQLVSFFVHGQEYALPIHVIQEVLRFMEPTKLPKAPPFVAGIVNLRGRVTPLVKLRMLIGSSSGGSVEDDRFIIVCRHRGLQVGLMIHAVATMYRVPQSDVEWGIESQIGVAKEFLSGVSKTAKSGKKLTGIISIERVVDRLLRG